MKINNTKIDDIKVKISEWATEKNLNTKFVERGGNITEEFGIESCDWGIEIMAQDGWAYLNGYNSINVSTTISDMTELPKALDKLLKYSN